MLVESNLCTGCTACKAVCPKSAITMEEDKEGFLHPIIHNDLCINCKLCEKVCPVTKEIKTEYERVYAAISRDDEHRVRSSSGGIFYEISKKVLNQGGYVCGAAFDEKNQVHHIVINDFKDIDFLMRSKYVQSRMEDCFKRIKELLIEGKQVLFVGTGCQVNGLVSFLQKKYDNLITLDIICHGVPSPKVWKLYLDYCNKTVGEDLKISDVNFRDKQQGWKDYGLSFKLSNDVKIYENKDSNVFMKVFLTDIALRPSCYNCHANGTSRYADLTLGDFWGYNNFDLKINHSNKGLSILVAHTEVGKKLLEDGNFDLEEIDSDALNYNPAYFKSWNEPKKRDTYMKTVNEDNFYDLSMKLSNVKRPLYRRVLGKIKRILKG